MGKWLVKATREAYEETAAIIEAGDERQAKEVFDGLGDTLIWSPGGEPSTMDYHIFSIERLDDDEPVGCEQNEEETMRRAAPLMLVALQALLAWNADMGGWDSRCWRAAMAARDRAKGGKGGWEVIDWGGYGLLHIERDDDADIWDTDEQAVEFVRQLARRGEPDAIDALAIHEKNEGEIERRRQCRPASPSPDPEARHPLPPR
jgi:hypothetical protein